MGHTTVSDGNPPPLSGVAVPGGPLTRCVS
jgi:hypothetical protein